MTKANKPIVTGELLDRLRAVVPNDAAPYVLTHLKQRLYSKAMGELRDLHHDEFAKLYVGQVERYIEEHS